MEVCQAYIGVSENVCWNHSMSLNERAGIIHFGQRHLHRRRLNEPFLTWYLETMTWRCFPVPGDLVVLYLSLLRGVESFCWPSPNSSIAARPIRKGKSGALDLSLVGLPVLCLAVCPWASHLPSLILSFLICKNRTSLRLMQAMHLTQSLSTQQMFAVISLPVQNL